MTDMRRLIEPDIPNEEQLNRIERIIEKTAWFMRWPDAETSGHRVLSADNESISLRIDFHLKGNTQHLYFRIARSADQAELLEHEFRNSQFLEPLFHNYRGLNAYQPISWLASEQALVGLALSESTRLDELFALSKRLVEADRRSLVESYEAAGQWLYVLQKATSKVPSPDFSPTIWTEKTKAVLDQLNRDVPGHVNAGHDAIIRDSLEWFLEQPDISPEVLCTRHSAYCPENMFWDGNTLIVTNFSDLQIDCVEYDFVYFLRHLDAMGRHKKAPDTVINSCRRAFIRGYQDSRPPIDHHASLLFHLLHLHLNLEATLAIISRKKAAFRWLRVQPELRFLTMERRNILRGLKKIEN